MGIGGDLEPGTLLAAYRSGLFPMHIGRVRRLAWWSPDPRGILPLDGLRGQPFAAPIVPPVRDPCGHRVRGSVLAACADPRRPHGWINRSIAHAYTELHRLGWAHSVEAWTPDGELAGGLYGVAIGGLFAGESMFHRRTDASKAALVGLVGLLDDGVADRVIDVQWRTEHLATLGVVEIPRAEYLSRLGCALRVPLPGHVAIGDTGSHE